MSLNHRFALCESIQLSHLNGERFIVRTHCEPYDTTTELLVKRGIRSQLIYRTDQDDRVLALVAAGMGIALMPAIFDAPKVKKVPVRDLDVKRVISLHWNKDVADDRLDRLVSFATTHNWAPSDGINLEIPHQLSSRVRKKLTLIG